MDVRDLSTVQLRSENEIDNAIYALLCAAFCEGDDAVIRRSVRGRLPGAPSPQDIIEACCAELGERRLLLFEAQRRLQATHVMAAFLDLPAAERADVSLAPAA